MKNKSLNMLIVALLIIAAMSVMLFVFLDDAHDSFRDDVTVSANGVTEKILNVRDLKLLPTEKNEYSVNFYCAASGLYGMTVDYVEKKDGGMKDYVNVTVLFADEVVYTGRLSELLDEKKDVLVNFEGQLHEVKPMTVTFIYEMPGNVGNEAQGTWADFDVCFKVTKL